MDLVQDQVQLLVRIKTIHAVLINIKLDFTLSNSVVQCWYCSGGEGSGDGGGGDGGGGSVASEN